MEYENEQLEMEVNDVAAFFDSLYELIESLKHRESHDLFVLDEQVDKATSTLNIVHFELPRTAEKIVPLFRQFKVFEEEQFKGLCEVL